MFKSLISHNNYDHYDHVFKIILLGNSSVGKSTLLHRYIDNMYSDNYISTIGVDFKIKNLDINNKHIKLQIWDTAGQERFKTIIRNYYNGVQGVILLFSLNDVNSFADIKIWFEEAIKYCNKKICFLLIGTKSDLTRKITTDEIQSLLSYINTTNNSIEYFETSSKYNINITDCFDYIAQTLLFHYKNIDLINNKLENNTIYNKDNNLINLNQQYNTDNNNINTNMSTNTNTNMSTRTHNKCGNC